MNRKLLVLRRETGICTALAEDGEIKTLSFHEPGEQALMGSIYIGRVQKVVKSIGAAFVEIAKDIPPCYYPLDDCETPVYTKKEKAGELAQGDELLVQVCREAQKTKPPSVTANLNFTGKYMVLTTGKKVVGVSKKLDKMTGTRLKQVITEHCDPSFGYIIRTNGALIPEEELLGEAKALTENCQRLLKRAQFLSCPSRVYQAPAPWLKALRDTYGEGLSILTDDPGLYGQIENYLQEYQPEDLPRLSLYKDPLLPMEKLYRIEHVLEEALKERVWLKSGAYLVIQPTEALTVIDVNTGKYTGKKCRQETYRQINLEAAQEVARQIRLRNLSGIIIVDFINMDIPENREELMKSLEALLRMDPVPAVLVDMTALNLVEITRKRSLKPLAEQVKKFPSDGRVETV